MNLLGVVFAISCMCPAAPSGTSYDVRGVEFARVKGGHYHCSAWCGDVGKVPDPAFGITVGNELQNVNFQADPIDLPKSESIRLRTGDYYERGWDDVSPKFLNIVHEDLPND